MKKPADYIGEVLFARFEIQDVLGSKGMGTVYLALDKKHNRKVALKTIKNTEFKNKAEEIKKSVEAARRFKREAQISITLEHQNIVRVYDYSADGDESYIAMEYLKGGDLAQKIENFKSENKEKKTELEKEREFEQKYKYLRMFARGLDKIHSHKNSENNYNGNEGKYIIHRDLKPENLLFDQDDNLKITDFGVAKEDNADENLTKAGDDVGTFKYQSPEQVLHEELTPKSDMYAFGLIAYELVVGSLPFDKSHQKLEFVINKYKLDFNLPVFQRETWLREIIERCCAFEVKDRFDSMQQVKLALDDRGEGSKLKNYYRTFIYKCEDNLKATKINCTIIASAIMLFSIILTFPFSDISSGNFGNKIDNSLIDNMQWLKRKALKDINAPEGILLAFIDEKTYEKFNVPKDVKKFPRELLSKGLNNLSKYNPRGVLLDFVYSDYNNTKVDIDLMESFKKLNTVVVKAKDSRTITNEYGERIYSTTLIEPNKSFADGAKAVVWATVPYDNDAVVRRFGFPDITGTTPMHGVLKIFNFNPHNSPKYRDFINFYGPKQTLKNISFYRLINDENLSSDFLKGQIVVIGQNLIVKGGAGQNDSFVTAIEPTMPGVEIHATILSNILDETWIKRFNLDIEMYFYIVISILITFCMLYLNYYAATYVFFISLISWIISFFIFYYQDIFLMGSVYFLIIMPGLYFFRTIPLIFMVIGRMRYSMRVGKKVEN